jgi:hypothetical protein
VASGEKKMMHEIHPAMMMNARVNLAKFTSVS